MVDIIYFLW